MKTWRSRMSVLASVAVVAVSLTAFGGDAVGDGGPQGKASAEASASGRVLFVRPTGLYSMSPDGRHQHLVYPSTKLFDPDMSPDGSKIAVVHEIPHMQGAEEILILRLDGSLIRSFGGGSTLDSPSWSPNGKRLAAYALIPVGIGEHDFGVITIDESGHYKTLFRSAEIPGQPIPSDPSWSPTGGTIAAAGQWTSYASSVFAYDRADKTLVPITDPGWHARHPDVAPNGRWIVYESWHNRRERHRHIRMVNTSGTKVRVLTTPGKRADSSPVFSPDGTSILFTRCCFGLAETNEVFTATADGSSVQRLTFTETNESDPTWGVGYQTASDPEDR